MITFKEYCKTIKEDWGTTSPIPKEKYADVDWRDDFKWIDLGLPSGTLWADINLTNPDKENGLWTYDDIMNSPYKDYVPSEKQMIEMKSHCKIFGREGGMIAKGKNGNEIFLPVSTRTYGGYLTSKLSDGGYVRALYIETVGVDYSEVARSVQNTTRRSWHSVRLVRPKGFINKENSFNIKRNNIKAIKKYYEN